MSKIMAPEWDAEIIDAPAGSEADTLATIRAIFDLALIDHLEEMGLPIPADLYEGPMP